jgi:predicted small lipoprotein YifL
MKKTFATALVIIALALLAGCKCGPCMEIPVDDEASFPVQDKWWE